MLRRSAKSASETSVLNKPGIVLPKPGRFSSFCFNTVLLWLAWAGAFGCFLTAFKIPLDRTQLALWSVFFAVVCAGQYSFERRKWIAPLCTLLVWGLALWRNFEDVSQGAFRVVNTMLSAYSEMLNLRTELPQIIVTPFLPGKQMRVITLFAVFLTFLFFWILSWFFVRHQSLLGAFCLTGLFLLSHLGFSILPNRWAFGLLLVFWAFLLLAAPSLRQRRLLVEDGTSFQSSGDMFLHPFSLILLPILALSMLLLYTVFPPETYERPQFIADLRKDLNNSLNLQTVFRNGDSGHSERVEFSSLGNRYDSGKFALRVRHDWHNSVPTFEESPVGQKDFLKGFVGSVYTSASWERLSEEDAETVNEIWGEKNVQTLPADLMQSMPMESDPHFSYFVSVRKLGGDSQSIYSPYGLYSPLGAPNNMEYQEDGFLLSPQLFSGTTEYALSAVATPSLDNLPTYLSRFDAYWKDLLKRGIPYDEDTLENLSQWIANSMGSVDDPPGDQWQVPDWIKDLLPTDLVSTIIEPLEQYNEFVYSHYTQVPDSLRGVLEQYSKEHGLPLSVKETDRVSYLRQVKQILAEDCTYSWTPPVVPKGSDFVTYFLTESRTGYCVHFATAATMLLRSAGIPARYAEGFAVPTGNGNWIDVPDYNAHAWVEVYWGGIGWIPVEMTPAGESVPAAYANAVSPSENDDLTDLLPIPSVSPSIAPDPVRDDVLLPSLPPLSADPTASPAANGRTSPSPSPSPGTGFRNGGGSSSGLSAFGMELFNSGKLTFFGFLFILILLVPVPILLIWAQRLIRLSLRKLSFRQRNRNKAALCVYAHLRRLYWENRLLPGDGIDPPEEIEALALKARFSHHTLTEAELAQLTEQAAMLEKKLKARLPRGEWLRCKYLRILF